MYAGKSSRDLVKFYLVHKYRKYALIDLEGRIDVKNLSIYDIHRREFIDATVPTLQFAEGAKIENLFIIVQMFCWLIKNLNQHPLQGYLPVKC